MNYKDILIRSLKTFIQAALSVLAVQVVTVNSWDAVWPVIIAAVSAGISAVMNVGVEVYKLKR